MFGKTISFSTVDELVAEMKKFEDRPGMLMPLAAGILKLVAEVQELRSEVERLKAGTT